MQAMASHGALHYRCLFLQVVCHGVLIFIVKLQNVATFPSLWAQSAAFPKCKEMHKVMKYNENMASSQNPEA